MTSTLMDAYCAVRIRCHQQRNKVYDANEDSCLRNRRSVPCRRECIPLLHMETFLDALAPRQRGNMYVESLWVRLMKTRCQSCACTTTPDLTETDFEGREDGINVP